MGNVWELRKGDILLGTLRLKNHDNFWLECDFVPMSAFESYRLLFEEEERLLEAALGEDGTNDIDDINNWELAYSKISELKLSLHIKDKFENENLIVLHIVGNN